MVTNEIWNEKFRSLYFEYILATRLVALQNPATNYYKKEKRFFGCLKKDPSYYDALFIIFSNEGHIFGSDTVLVPLKAADTIQNLCFELLDYHVRSISNDF